MRGHASRKCSSCPHLQHSCPGIWVVSCGLGAVRVAAGTCGGNTQAEKVLMRGAGGGCACAWLWCCGGTLRRGAGVDRFGVGERLPLPWPPGWTARWSSARVTAASSVAGRWYRTHAEVRSGSPPINCSRTTFPSIVSSAAEPPGCSHRVAASRSWRKRRDGPRFPAWRPGTSGDGPRASAPPSSRAGTPL